MGFRHRVYLLDLGVGSSSRARFEHWRTAHPLVVIQLPGVIAYRQSWPHDDIGSLVCSETWFADAAAERDAFSSDVYRDLVMPDEDKFVTVPARHAVVLSPVLPGAGRHQQVLGFDQDSMTVDGRRHLLSRSIVADPLVLTCDAMTWLTTRSPDTERAKHASHD
jgi:hypothetical protein